MKKYSTIFLMRRGFLFTVSVFSFIILANPIFSTTHQRNDLTQKAPVMFAHSWDEKIDITGWWMKVKTYEGADATVCSQLNSLWVFVTFNSKLLRTITGQEKIDELPS